MAELFAVDVRTINEHLKNIFQSSERITGTTVEWYAPSISGRGGILGTSYITPVKKIYDLFFKKWIRYIW